MTHYSDEQGRIEASQEASKRLWVLVDIGRLRDAQKTNAWMLI